MKDCQDAYGHMIYDYFKGAREYEIVERDDGCFDASANKAYFTEYKDWPMHQKKAMRYVKGRTLDIGCGAGRHSLYLQGKGFDVLGIDLSPLAIKVCKLRGLKRARVMSVTQINAGLGTFDTILMLGNNFGLFGSYLRAKWLLRRFKGMTSERARLIVESLDPYDTTDRIHLDYHKINKKRGRMGGQVRIRVRYKKYATPWFDYLLVSKKEMEDILKGTGWSVGRYMETADPWYIAIIERENPKK